MHTLMTVLRKRPEISTAVFRHFMEFEYGPIYAAMPQIKAYVHYYLTDISRDTADRPIDAIVLISFASPESMKVALSSDEYQKAHSMRQAYISEASDGIHPSLVEKIVKLV
jgi:hypothetical protein